MKKLEVPLTIIGIVVFFTATIIYISTRKKAKWKKFWKKMIYGVISVEHGFNTPCNNIWSKGCAGKRYTDVLHLDSGTIGIAHWASGGLCRIYENMDTQKYFGKSQREMCKNYAHKSSGASDKSWWINGFQRWVRDVSPKKQDELFIQSRQDAVDAALKNGWKTDRELAIAIGISNSYGNSGFISKANKYGWNAEDLINRYINKFGAGFSNHKNKRKKQIDKWFPQGQEKIMV